MFGGHVNFWFRWQSFLARLLARQCMVALLEWSVWSVPAVLLSPLADCRQALEVAIRDPALDVVIYAFYYHFHK